MDITVPGLYLFLPSVIPGFLKPSELNHYLVLKSYLNVFIICLINPLRGSNVQVPVTDVVNGIFT